MAHCKDCGQEVGAGDRFCRNCGSSRSGSHGETKDTQGAPTAVLLTKPCAYCDGTGEVDVGMVVSVFETCPVCKGACEVRVPADYVRCRSCDGTGKELVGEIITVLEPCGRCKGTGWAPPPPVCA